MKKTTLKVASTMLLAAAAFGFMSCGEKDTGKGRYTYRSSATPFNTWNPTDYQMNQDGVIIGYISSGFYDFVINDTMDGYRIQPCLATKLAEDVTAEYAGKYGVPANANKGYAFKVEMRKDATWDDGTPINADTFEYSLKQYLNPDMKNYRSNSAYELASIANARAYYDGSVAYSDASAPADNLWMSLTQTNAFFSNNVEAYGPDSSYGDLWTVDGVNLYEKLVEIVGDHTYAQVTPEAKEILITMTKAFGDDPNNWYQWCFTREEKTATPWSEVGYVKNDDYTFTLVFSKQYSEFDFYYHGISLQLVKEDLYEANKKATGDIIKTSYGTSVEKSASYGPYKVSDYQEGKSLHLTKNDKWFGWQDDFYKTKYMTTDLDFQVLSDHETIVNLFLQGKLDSLDLSASDMDKYGNSEYRIKTPRSYTWKFTLNMDRRALQAEDGDGIVHSVLANYNFRKAMSLSLDRQSWIETVSPAATPGYGLINYSYVADPETGALYRNTPQAEAALCAAYGVTNLEDMTGYDLVESRALFQKAYEEEIRDGYLKPTDRVEFDYHAGSSSEGNQRRVSFLQDSINKATEGTGFEGKVKINLIVDQDYYTNLPTGSVDIALTAWGGASFDPYGTLWCYCTDEALLEFGLPIHKDTVTVNINGKKVTHTFAEWYEELCIAGGTYTAADFDVKNEILATVEKALLSYYDMLPMEYDNVLSLDSQRLIEYTEDYINDLVERGGLMELRYSMDDAEWDAYCKKQNNQLTY